MNLEEIKARKIEREKTNTYAPRIAEFEYLLKLIEEQQKEIFELNESLHIARVGRRDLTTYVKQLKEENEWLYSKLNKISDVNEKAREEIPKF